MTMILDIYVIRIVGALGIFFNIFNLVLLLHKSLKHSIYNFFWSRCFFNLVVCIFACGSPVLICLNDEYEYLYIFYRVYISRTLLEAFLIISAVSDLLLIVSRYLAVIEKKNYFTRLSKITNILICFVFIIFYIPAFFTVEIVPGTKLSKIKITEFGLSLTWQLYFLVLTIFSIVLPVKGLTIMNTMSIYSFKKLKRMSSHILNENSRKKRKKRENNFTKMVVILTIISIVSRTIYMIVCSLFTPFV